MSPNLRWNQDVIFTSKIVDNRCFMFMSKFLVYIQFFFWYSNSLYSSNLFISSSIFIFQPFIYCQILYFCSSFIFMLRFILCSCTMIKVNASILCWTFNFYVPKLCWDHDVILTFKMRCSCVPKLLDKILFFLSLLWVPSRMVDKDFLTKQN